MDGKTKAIVAHITLIGWVIALVLNSSEKDELASYYIRQLLGLYIFGLVLSFIPILGWILNIVVFVFWIMSLIGSIQEKRRKPQLSGNIFRNGLRHCETKKDRKFNACLFSKNYLFPVNMLPIFLLFFISEFFNHVEPEFILRFVEP